MNFAVRDGECEIKKILRLGTLLASENRAGDCILKVASQRGKSNLFLSALSIVFIINSALCFKTTEGRNKNVRK